jgi:chromosome segregation ATPase
VKKKSMDNKAKVTGTTARLPYILLVFSLGTMVVLWYNRVQLVKQRDQLQEEVKAANKRMALLKKKKSEESQLIQVQQLRERSSLAGQIQAAESQIQAAEGRVAVFQKENGSISQQYESVLAQKKRLDLELQTLSSQKEEMRNSWEKTKKELAELSAAYEKVNRDLKQLTEEKRSMKKTLESELEKMRQKLGQCEAHNARLCTIAHELIDKYRTKGLVNTLLQKEPFTQLKRVEVDELMQEYQEKIEQQKLHRTSDQAGSLSSPLSPPLPSSLSSSLPQGR